jgi:hypothetical protein
MPSPRSARIHQLDKGDIGEDIEAWLIVHHLTLDDTQGCRTDYLFSIHPLWPVISCPASPTSWMLDCFFYDAISSLVKELDS